jgi:putative peptide zinc metalloprotease protein
VEVAALSARLLSNSWYRVAGLKPRLRAHARLHRHRYRGEVWYLLQDRASGRVHRFTPAARTVIAAMDGERSVAQIWEAANASLGEAAPTQDEVIQLLGQLHAADLLQSDVTPDVAELFARGERELQSRRKRSYGNPLAVRLPLWDPEAFLERLRPALERLWSRWGAIVWLAVVLPALFLVPPNWPELTHNFSDRVLAVDNLLVLYLLFPLIKAFHELGHASATKAGGGEVHDMGLNVLLLMPVPYVEASAATAFRSKYRRAVVGAAGMAVELFIAAFAFYAWLLVEPGSAKAVLFNVMLIAGVSTLVFNGNPLLRYDAYYILCDLIEMPNLAMRASRYWGYLFERYALGAHEAEPPDATRSEKAWFVFYGLAGTAYRMFVTVVIALFIASRFFLIGVLLAVWALAAMALVPLVRALRHVVTAPSLRRRRGRALGVTFGSAAALALLLVAGPLPYHSDAEGVVWLSEQAIVRTATGGFVQRFEAKPGTRVAAGDALVLTYEPALQAQLRLSEARLEELEASYAAEFVADRARAKLVRDKLESARAELALAEERVGDSIVRARAGGVFVVPQSADLPGRYFHKGELLGYVIGRDDAPLVRVVVPQDAINAVRIGTDRVRVRLAGRPEVVTEGRIVRQVPAGESYLPSRALAVEGGGQIATDPRDARGPKALERMFQFDVALPGARRLAVFGERAYVRFEHRAEPLAMRWYRDVRRLFLSHFGV